MKSGFRKVVLVGDKFTKLDFIFEFLNETSKVSLRKKCQDASPIIEVVHSENFVDQIIIDTAGSNILVLSAVFPSGIKFSADLSETDWIHCQNVQGADLILFIEAYPFTSDTLIMRIELIEEFLMAQSEEKDKHLQSNNKRLKNIPFRVIFFKDQDQHFGDTDKVDIDEALRCAPDSMIKRLEKSSNCMLSVSSLVDFKIYKDATDLIDIVSCTRKTFKILTSVSTEKFKQWQADVECYCEDYKREYDYQFAASLRFEVIHNRINKFSVVKGSSDIMRQYAKNYLQKCFDEVKKIAVEQYRESVKNICFWDFDKDGAVLSSKLDKLCLDELTFKEHLPCPETQADYQKILTEKKIDIKFSEKVKDLEQNDVPGLVYQYLKKKEEILFGAFGE